MSSLTPSLLGLMLHITWTKPLLFIQSEVYRKIWNLCSSCESLWNSTCGGHSSASMLTPKLRMTEMKSIVYLGDDLKSASLWCPRLFSAVRSSVYVPVDTCQSVYVNVQMFLPVCLFVCMSVWVLQTERGSVELSAIDICSSSSSEQLHLSVLAPAHPTASQTLFTLNHFSARGECVSSALWLSLLWLRCSYSTVCTASC